MRLNRFLAAAGIGSRRHCDELIASGQVTINGRPCTDFSVQPTEHDHVKVGRKLVRVERPLHIALHKPAGFVSTRKIRTRETRFLICCRQSFRGSSILAGSTRRAKDCSFSRMMATSRKGSRIRDTKSKRNTRSRSIAAGIRRWRQSYCAEFISTGSARRSRGWLRSVPRVCGLFLRQGINRQIRRMFYDIGYEVERLLRTRIGTLRLGDLPRGNWRPLTTTELRSLRPSSRTK